MAQVTIRIRRGSLTMSPTGVENKVQFNDTISVSDTHRLKEAISILGFMVEGEVISFQPQTPEPYPSSNKHVWKKATPKEEELFNSFSKEIEVATVKIKEIRGKDFSWNGDLLHILKKELFVRVRNKGGKVNYDIRVEDLQKDMIIVGISRGNEIYLKATDTKDLPLAPCRSWHKATTHDLKVIEKNKNYFLEIIKEIQKIHPTFWTQGEIFVAAPEFGVDE